MPSLDQLDPGERPIAEEAYRYMDLQPGTAIAGVPVDAVSYTHLTLPTICSV